LRVQSWTLVQIVAALGLVVLGALALLAPLWIPLAVPGFDAAGRALTVTLVRIQFAGTFGTLVLMVCWSAHYARQQFVWVESSNVIAGVVGLVALWLLLPVTGVAGAAWAMVLRAGLQCVLLLPGLGAYARPDRDAAARLAVWRRLVPLVLAALYGKADPVVERAIASLAPP